MSPDFGYVDGECHPIGGLDFVEMDSVDDIIKDVAKAGKLPELMDRLNVQGDGFGAEERLEFVRTLMIELMPTKRRELTYDALAWASGLGEDAGYSLEHYAKKHKVTRAYMHKVAKRLRTNLRLPKRECEKSEEAKLKYKLINDRDKNGQRTA